MPAVLLSRIPIQLLLLDSLSKGQQGPSPKLVLPDAFFPKYS